MLADHHLPSAGALPAEEEGESAEFAAEPVPHGPLDLPSPGAGMLAGLGDFLVPPVLLPVAYHVAVPPLLPIPDPPALERQTLKVDLLLMLRQR